MEVKVNRPSVDKGLTQLGWKVQVKYKYDIRERIKRKLRENPFSLAFYIKATWKRWPPGQPSLLLLGANDTPSQNMTSNFCITKKLLPKKRVPRGVLKVQLLSDGTSSELVITYILYIYWVNMFSLSYPNSTNSIKALSISHTSLSAFPHILHHHMAIQLYNCWNCFPWCLLRENFTKN